MRIVLEDYDRNIHGYEDDCDYVITFTEDAQLLANEIAERLTDHINKYDDKLYLCHS